MNSINSDSEKILKLIHKMVRNGDELFYGMKIYNIVSTNQEAWDYVMQELREYNGDINVVTKRFLLASHMSFKSSEGTCDIDKKQHYTDFGRWAYQESYKIAMRNNHVPIETKIYLLYSDSHSNFITFSEKIQFILSLIDKNNKWAEYSLSSFYLSAILLDNGMYPTSELKKGYDVTKKLVYNILEKYTDNYISNITKSVFSEPSITLGDCYPFSYYKHLSQFHFSVYPNNKIDDDIVSLFCFGYVCIKNNEDEIAYLSLTTADKLLKKMSEVVSIDKYNINENYCTILTEPLIKGNGVGSLSSFCHIPCDKDMGDLCYRIGNKFENGNSIEEYKQAIEFYKLAANYGKLESMYSLAKMYYSNSRYFPKNEKNARYWLNKAVENDVIEAIQFLNEHPELKEGVKNVTYHADGDIIQGNRGIIAKDDAIINRSTVESENDFFEDIPDDNCSLSKKETSKSSNVLNNDYIFCIECGTKLPANAKFCFNCGMKVSDDINLISHNQKTEIICLNCGTKLSEDDIFCPECGMKRD